MIPARREHVTTAERRRFPRVSIDAPVQIEWGSQQIPARVSDLSLGGMFIVTSDPLWVNAGFTARVLMQEPLTIDCVVRRVIPGEGMGVEFDRLTPELRERLERLIESANGK